MARRKITKRNIRKLSKGGTSYFVTIPMEAVKKFGWKKSQKLIVDADKKRKRLTIKDWNK